MLARFVAHYYYNVFYHDDSIEFPHVKISSEGRHLIAQYYKEKYGISISFHQNFIDFVPYLKKFLTDHADKKDFRHAFYIGDNGSHAMPVIYLCEEGKKGFLSADSLGDKTGHTKENGIEIETIGSSRIAEKAIKSVTEIPVYVVTEQSLADSFSCGVHSLVFARDCASSHLTPKLLDTLLQRAENKNGTLEIKLPDVLLKHSQISLFTKTHQQHAEAIVHHHKNQPETLAKFLERYRPKNQNHYLRIKGIKFVDIIEIQFYLTQLKLFFKEKWTPQLQQSFIAAAKDELRAQWQISLNVFRPGLFSFANQFKKHVEIVLEKKEQVSFFTSQQDFEKLAEQIFAILNEKKYWASKTFWFFGTEEGITLMQQTLKELERKNTSTEGKFHALRKIALAEASKKSIFYLLTSFNFESRDEHVISFLSLFTQDLRFCQEKIDKIKQDIQKFTDPLWEFQKEHLALRPQ